MDTLPGDILRTIVGYLPPIYSDMLRLICHRFRLYLSPTKKGNIASLGENSNLFIWAFQNKCPGNIATISYFAVIHDQRKILQILAENIDNLYYIGTAAAKFNNLNLLARIHNRLINSHHYSAGILQTRSIAIATRYAHKSITDYFGDFSLWHAARYGHAPYNDFKISGVYQYEEANWESICIGAVIGNNIDLLDWLHTWIGDPYGDMNYIIDTTSRYKIYNTAVRTGNPTLIIKLEAFGYIANDKSYITAAKHGHLHLLTYLYNKYPNKDSALSAAIVANHIDLFKLAYPGQYMSKQRCIKKAKNYNRKEILDWILNS